MKNIDYKTVRKLKKKKRQLQIIFRVGSFVVALGVALGMTVSYRISKEKKKTDEVANINIQEDNTTKETQEQTTAIVEVEETTTYPELSTIYVDIQSEEVVSPYAVLLDVEENEMIAGKNVYEKIYPASMTKVMTMIVVVETLSDLEQTTQMQQEVIYNLYLEDASMIGYEAGDVATAKDLLYGLILHSGADASTALAMMTAGTEEAFAELMNQKCAELGLTSTHFVNSSGLFDENQYTTPIEMAKILEYAMNIPICKEILGTRNYKAAPTASSPDGIWLSHGMFRKLAYYEETEEFTMLGGKTGYTQEAGNCLASCVEKNGKLYVAVVAKAPGSAYMMQDTLELYRDYLPAY